MNDEIKEILDYIDDKIIPNEKWNEVKDYITNLQEENKHLDKVNCQLRKKINNDIYKSRNDKAVEYIENDLKSFLYSIEYKTLLNILNGGDE